jgi:hypothetical protein
VNLSFIKPMQDWEVDLVHLILLYSLRLRQGGEDKICWIPSKRRKFEVRSFIMRCLFLLVPISLEEYLES